MLYVAHTTFRFEEEVMSGPQFWRRTGLVIATASVINIAIYFIAKAAGVEILVPQGETPTPLSVGPVIAFTIIPLVLAALLVLVLRRVGVSSPRVFAGVVVIVGLLSLLAPLTAGLSASNALVLAAMHVVAGLAALLGLTPMYRVDRAEAPAREVSNA
jgi:hypothetical protein